MFESKRPSAKPECHQWTHITLKPGESIKGWSAGPATGADGHYAPSFKPCRTALTDGAVACPYCAIPLATRFAAFLPFYDQHLRRLVITVNEEMAGLTDALAPLTAITVKKGASKVGTVVVTASAWTTLAPTGPKVRRTCQDLMPWLVDVIWRAEGLSAVYHARAGAGTGAEEASDIAVSLTPDAPPAKVASEEKKPRVSIKELMRQRAKKAEADAQALRAEADVLERRPSKRG
jgi:hypothetical protein